MAWARRSASARRWRTRCATGQFGFHALVGGGQLGLGLVGGSQAFGDLRSALVQRRFAIGGHTNFIVNPTRIRNTII
jgi:hypothetical protein